MTERNKVPERGRNALADFAPALTRYSDQVLFGDVWARPELPLRDRSLLTVAALVAGGNAEQLTFHLEYAKRNGLTEAELIEAITHLAFYAGWPKAMSAMAVAKRVFQGE
jgi:4-carboxymuconolactone decarboxylase